MRGLFLLVLAAAAVVRGHLYRGPRYINLGIVGVLRPVTVGYNRETLSRLSAFDRFSSSSVGGAFDRFSSSSVGGVGPTFVASGISGGSTIGPGPYLAGSSVTDVRRTIAPFSSGPLSGAVDAYDGIGPGDTSGPYYDGPYDSGSDGPDYIPDVGPLDGLSGSVSGVGGPLGGDVTTVRTTRRVTYPSQGGIYSGDIYNDGPSFPYDGLDSLRGGVAGVGPGVGVGGGVTTVRRTTRYYPGSTGVYPKSGGPYDTYDDYGLYGSDGLGVGSGVGGVGFGGDGGFGGVTTVRRTSYYPGVSAPSIAYTGGFVGGDNLGSVYDLPDFNDYNDYDRLSLYRGGSGLGGEYSRDIQYSLGGRSGGIYTNPYRFRGSGIRLGADAGFGGDGFGDGFVEGLRSFGGAGSSVGADFDTGFDTSASSAEVAGRVAGATAAGLTSGSTGGSYAITDPRILPNY